jgi:polysaccharide biosynthesis protein VpsM
MVRLGEDAAVFFTLQTSLRLDDNIYLRPDSEKGDTIFVAVPGASLEFGDPTTTNGQFAVREAFLRYFDNDSENDELASAEARLKMPGPRGELEFAGTFEQLRENTREYREFSSLTQRDHASARVRAEYEVSAKTSVSGGVSVDNEDFKTVFFRDRRDLSLPWNAYYELTPKVDMSVGYVYRRERLSGPGNYRYRDHFLNVGARGEFTPKLQGYVQVGVTDRRLPGGIKDSTLGLDGSVTWAATPKSSYEITASRGFRASSIDGESWADTRASVTARYAFSDAWSALGELRYQHAGYYGGRRDDFVTGAITTNWSPKEFIVLSCTLTLQTNDSSSRNPTFDFNFDRSLFSFAAALRY